jgi:hypothetical protein
MAEVKQIVLVYDDGTTMTVAVEQCEEPPVEETFTVARARKKKRAKPRRRCTVCEQLVPKDEFEDHKQRHAEGMQGPPKPQDIEATTADAPAEASDGDISIFDKEE